MITFRKCSDCETQFDSALEIEMMSTVGISLDSFEVEGSSKTESLCPECGSQNTKEMYGPCASRNYGKWASVWFPDPSKLKEDDGS